MSTTPLQTHGGHRPGAGRPHGTTKPDALRNLVTTRLTDAERDKAAAIGEGKIGRGLRVALGACQRRGRAPADADGKRVQTGVKMSDAERAKAVRIGGGNASEGIRRALADWGG